MNRVRLGVNVDHVATLRQARGTTYPDPVAAAALAELGGADQITIHLREDRRHIQDRDLRLMRQTVQTRLNLEMAATEEMVTIAREVGPGTATLVPERRQELTTEGGLDVAGQAERIAAAVSDLEGAGIAVSLFIDPDPAQISASARAGAGIVELHTGRYCDATTAGEQEAELKRLVDGARLAAERGLTVAAGHGLHYHNLDDVLAIPELVELNIGHSIVARAVMVGLVEAVREMRRLLER